MTRQTYLLTIFYLQCVRILYSRKQKQSYLTFILSVYFKVIQILTVIKNWYFKNSHKIPLVSTLGFPKCGLPFYALNIFGIVINFVPISTILVHLNKIEIWMEFQYFSCDINSTKKGSPHLKIPGLDEFCSYYFKSHACERRLTTKCPK